MLQTAFLSVVFPSADGGHATDKGLRNTGLSPLHKWPQFWSFLCLWICLIAGSPNLGPVFSARDLKEAASAVESTSQISNSLLPL